jgi:hypothetical protein
MATSAEWASAFRRALGKSGIPASTPVNGGLYFEEVTECAAIGKLVADLFGLPLPLAFSGVAKPGQATVVFCTQEPSHLALRAATGDKVYEHKTPHPAKQLWAVYAPPGFLIKALLLPTGERRKTLSFSLGTEPLPSLKDLFAHPPDDGIFWTTSLTEDQFSALTHNNNGWCTGKACVLYQKRRVTQANEDIAQPCRSCDVLIRKTEITSNPWNKQTGVPVLTGIETSEGAFLYKLWDIKDEPPSIEQRGALKIHFTTKKLNVRVFFPRNTAYLLGSNSDPVVLAKKWWDSQRNDEGLRQAALHYCHRDRVSCIYMNVIDGDRWPLLLRDILALKETNQLDAFFGPDSKRAAGLSVRLIKEVYDRKLIDVFRKLVAEWFFCVDNKEVFALNESDFAASFLVEIDLLLGPYREERFDLNALKWCNLPFLEAIREKHRLAKEATRDVDTRMGLYCPCPHCTRIRVLSPDPYQGGMHDFLILDPEEDQGDHLWRSGWNGCLEVTKHEIWPGCKRVRVYRLGEEESNNKRTRRSTCQRHID